MTYWSTAADLLRRPKLAHDVNDKIADLTDTRIDDYEVILATIARSLTLPAPSPSPGSETVADPAQSLEASALTWNRDRFALRHEPGQVRPRRVENVEREVVRSQWRGEPDGLVVAGGRARHRHRRGVDRAGAIAGHQGRAATSAGHPDEDRRIGREHRVRRAGTHDAGDLAAVQRTGPGATSDLPRRPGALAVLRLRATNTSTWYPTNAPSSTIRIPEPRRRRTCRVRRRTGSTCHLPGRCHRDSCHPPVTRESTGLPVGSHTIGLPPY